MPRTILLMGAPSFADVLRAVNPPLANSTTPAPLPSRSFYTVPTTLVPNSELGETNSAGSNSDITIPQDVQDLSSFQAEITLSSPDSRPQWRSLPLTPQHLRTSLSQEEWLLWTPLEWAQRSIIRDSVRRSHEEIETEPDTSFATDSEEPTQRSKDHRSSGRAFLEQSFALHCESDAPTHPAPSSSKTKDSFETDNSTLLPSEDELQQTPSSPLGPKSARKGQPRPTSLFPARSELRLLKNPPMTLSCIPSASEITHAYPSTLTANIIVSVMAIKPPRGITMRKTGRTVQLVEILVADDTEASSFGISFWLHSSSNPGNNRKCKPPPTEDGLRDELQNLRVGDVVLITNFALAQWNGLVHGASLARRTWRTTVSILWTGARKSTKLGRAMMAKGGLDSRDGCWSQRALSVKKWVMQNIVPGGFREASPGERLVAAVDTSGERWSKKRKFLPDDDTQEW